MNETDLLPGHTEIHRNAVLDVRGLEIEYVNGTDRFRAVRDVSFELARGQKLAIVGESGCGKTTLALALLRLIESPGRITGGDIVVNGRSILALSERELESVRGCEVAIVFQDPATALDPVKRIGKQIMEMIEQHNPGLTKSELRRQATEVMESTELPAAAKRFDAYPHELSGGLRQRVVIAIAIANQPDVLVADEPTSALDVTTQAQIMDLLERLVGERGIGVVLITHNLGVVAEFCDTVAVMYAGRFVERADVDSIFRAPAHPYTDALLRSVPRPGGVREPLPSLPGFPPNLAWLPPGCSFEPRCPLGHGDERCRRESPSPRERRDDYGVTLVECHYAAVPQETTQ